MTTRTTGDFMLPVSQIRDRFESANSSFESLTGDTAPMSSVSMDNIRSPIASGAAKRIPPKTKPKPITASCQSLSMDEEATAIITRLNSQIWVCESAAFDQPQGRRTTIIEDEVFSQEAVVGGASEATIRPNLAHSASKARPPPPAVRPRRTKPSESVADSPTVDAPFNRSATIENQSASSVSGSRDSLNQVGANTVELKPDVEISSFNKSSTTITASNNGGDGFGMTSMEPTAEVQRASDVIGALAEVRQAAYQNAPAEGRTDRVESVDQVRRLHPVAAKRTNTIKEVKLKPPVAARRSSSLRSYPAPQSDERNTMTSPEGAEKTEDVATTTADSMSVDVKQRAAALDRHGSNRGPPPPPPVRRTPIHVVKPTVSHVHAESDVSGSAQTVTDDAKTAGFPEIDRVRRLISSGSVGRNSFVVNDVAKDDVNNNSTFNRINTRVDVNYHQNNLPPLGRTKDGDRSLGPSTSAVRPRSKLMSFNDANKHQQRSIAPQDAAVLERQVVNNNDDVDANRGHDVAGNRKSYAIYGELVSESFTFLDEFDDEKPTDFSTDSNASQRSPTVVPRLVIESSTNGNVDDTPSYSPLRAQPSSPNDIRFTSQSNHSDPTSSSVSRQSDSGINDVGSQQDEQHPAVPVPSSDTAPPAVSEDHGIGADSNLRSAGNRKSYIVYSEFVGENFTFLEDFDDEEDSLQPPPPPPLPENFSASETSTDDSNDRNSTALVRSSSSNEDDDRDLDQPIVIIRPPGAITDSERYKRASVGQLEAISTVSTAFRFLDFSDSV